MVIRGRGFQYVARRSDFALYLPLESKAAVENNAKILKDFLLQNQIRWMYCPTVNHTKFRPLTSICNNGEFVFSLIAVSVGLFTATSSSYAVFFRLSAVSIKLVKLSVTLIPLESTVIAFDVFVDTASPHWFEYSLLKVVNPLEKNFVIFVP